MPRERCGVSVCWNSIYICKANYSGDFFSESGLGNVFRYSCLILKAFERRIKIILFYKKARV